MDRSNRGPLGAGSAADTRTAIGVDQVPIPTMQSGRWYRLPAVGNMSTTAPAGGLMHATPKFIPGTTTLDRLGGEVSTIGDSGSKVRLGIYADDGTFRPGTLVLDAGQILGDSATVQTITISQSLSRGWYWFAMVNQSVSSVAPTWRIASSLVEPCPIDTTTTPAAGGAVLALTQTSVTAALPSTFTASPGRATFAVASFGRVA